ncbi:Gldg family protein [Pseudobacter ginsenosidimutans]|uniref:ABC-2 type transport system permease protein n=2 Tax=Pseudobacter ginsenosidimutans TaxID=661488 RepID=A0A4Q7MP36_9BACT|nr:Gldg family protein [Pseudobacter ginsenosidimutans]RZS69368.1 ABC-2 type transport system permease protein [Pseudobacter ginsenosidimutans]
MKTILKIARAELRNLFFSPVAWFLAVVFMIQCAVFYSGLIYNWSKMQELGMKSPKFKGFDLSFTKIIYLDRDGIFVNVMMNLYLFIPLITMGLLSREVSNGSIKLLYSSPVKTRQIVFGKYLAVMLFNLLLVSIVGIFMVAGAFNIRQVDFGMLLSASLGFYLLICAYAAIGLFMSSLTTYQIVSAIGTFILIFILSRIGSLWQDIDFVRDLTYFLSISGRTEKMLFGLITTKDLFYFFIVISMFIGFTLLKLKSGRESKPKYVTFSKYLALVVCAVLLGYVTSRPALTGYLDATAEKSNTIHPRVQKIVKGLTEEPLEVTLYTNLLGKNAGAGFPEGRNKYLSGLWEQYQRFKPDMEFKFEYYYDLSPDSYYFRSFPGKSIHDIAKEVAKAMDLDLNKFRTPEEMKKIINLEEEGYGLVMQVKYKGKTTFLRTFQDGGMWPDEAQVAAALSRLQNLQMPKVLFISGNLERDPFIFGERGYSIGAGAKENRPSLVNNGFDVDTISLDHRDILSEKENIAMVVLADPKTELSAIKKEKIQQFINGGGNMLILGEPGKEDLLNPLMTTLGVQFDKGNLIQVSKHNTPDILGPFLTDSAAYLADEHKLIQFRTKFIDSLYTGMESVTPVVYSDTGSFAIQPLVKAMPQVWLKRGKLVKDSVQPVINIAEGDHKNGPFMPVVALSRKQNNKEQRIVVAGDADFMSNRYLGGDYLGRGIYCWLDHQEYPVYGPRPIPKDNVIKITPNTASALKVSFVWILPAAVALLGSIILIRRKRK